jgi:hypothetical protein
MASLCVIFDLQKIQQWALSALFLIYKKFNNGLSLRYFLSTKNSTMGSLSLRYFLSTKNSTMGSLCVIFDLQIFNNGLSLSYF